MDISGRAGCPSPWPPDSPLVPLISAPEPHKHGPQRADHSRPSRFESFPASFAPEIVGVSYLAPFGIVGTLDTTAVRARTTSAWSSPSSAPSLPTPRASVPAPLSRPSFQTTLSLLSRPGNILRSYSCSYALPTKGRRRRTQQSSVSNMNSNGSERRRTQEAPECCEAETP